MIVIAVAAEEEIKHLKKIMSVQKTVTYGKAEFFQGQIEHREVVLVKTGIGSKKARSAVRKAIEQYRPRMIILMGAAGAVDPALNIGDVVVVDAIKQMHGKKPVISRCDSAFNKKTMAILHEAGIEATVHNCMVFSSFVHLRQEKIAIMKTHDVVVIDMESAAVATEASLKNIPLIDIRIVSDTAREDTLNVERVYREKKKTGIAGLVRYFICHPKELKRAILLRKHLFIVSKKMMTLITLLLKDGMVNEKSP